MKAILSLSSLLVLTAFISHAGAVGSFQAIVEVRRPNSNGAVVAATIAYDGPGYRYRYDYTGRTYHEISRFRSDFGTNPFANADQWLYQVGQFCDGGCRADRLDYAFPIYWNDATKYRPAVGPSITVDGQSCAPHTPIGPSPLTRIWFTGTGTVCRALWSDGAEHTFLSVTPGSPPATTFAEPSDCRCGDKLDLVIMLDRSASMSQKKFARTLKFARKFVRKFAVSPAQVHVAIGLFDARAEVPILELYQGISLDNVDAALDTISCECPGETLAYDLGRWNELSPDKPVECCARRTSISASLDDVSAYLTANSRVGARKAVLVMTDGRHNTLVDGTACTEGPTCKNDLAAAVARIVNAHPLLEFYAVGMRRYDKLTHTKYYSAERTHYLEGAVGCSDPAYYCDPNACGGLCECAECTAPSSCDAAQDFCTTRTVDVPARVCVSIDRDCATGSPACTTSSCNSMLGACEHAPVVCPEAINSCYSNVCDDQVDRCLQQCNFGTCNEGSGPCGNVPGCLTDAQCDDGNVCTFDSCDSNGLCNWQADLCDDNDSCTSDFCYATLGCQHSPAPAAIICNDGVSCTEESCSNDVCIHTPVPCDDGLECTTDYCDLGPGGTGRCVYEPIVCPNGLGSPNCTLTYCDFGECQENVLGQPVGCPGAVVGTTTTTLP